MFIYKDKLDLDKNEHWVNVLRYSHVCVCKVKKNLKDHMILFCMDVFSTYFLLDTIRHKRCFSFTAQHVHGIIFIVTHNLLLISKTSDVVQKCLLVCFPSVFQGQGLASATGSQRSTTARTSPIWTPSYVPKMDVHWVSPLR